MDTALQIDVNDPRAAVRCDRERLVSAVRRVLQDAGIRAAEISVAVVDDATIHQLNRRYLHHDYATDVLSFVLARSEGHLEGEIIASADTAARRAAAYEWTADDELLLYVVHGALHLVGFDDTTAEDRLVMRKEEQRHLARWNIEPPYDQDAAATAPRVSPGGSIIGDPRR